MDLEAPVAFAPQSLLPLRFPTRLEASWGILLSSPREEKMLVEHVRMRVASICLASALSGCNNDGVSTPTRGPTPTPPPTGTFAVASTTPAFGGTVFGPAEAMFGQTGDISGTTGLAVPIQITYSDSIPSFFFVVELLNGQTECLRAPNGNCDRTDGSPLLNSYAAGSSATFLCRFFVRDSTQPTCGPTFTTDRIRLVLQNEARHTLFVQEVSGGWTFKFVL